MKALAWYTAIIAGISIIATIATVGAEPYLTEPWMAILVLILNTPIIIFAVWVIRRG